MELLVLAERSTETADALHFSGTATVQRFIAAEPSLPGRAYRVTFSPGTITNWHTHDGVQLLLILDGHCAVQVWDGEMIIAGPGDVVRIEATEKHWHGATEDHPTTHFAINLGQSTEWLEEVS